MVTDRVQHCEDRALCTRIVGEYLEMPGLNLTLAQGARLWSMKPRHCLRLLETLVQTGFLRKTGNCYVRAHVGRHAA